VALSAGTSLGRLPEKNAALGAGLKLSTGTMFWNGGVRVALQPPSDAAPRKTSILKRLRYGVQQAEGGRLQGTSVAPSGTRFGLRTSALAAVHESRVAGNGHTAWSLMQPARLKGQGFVVQELPLPLVSAPSGATWLKVKVQTPSSSCFVHGDRSTREGPSERGRITAALQADQLIGRDYSKLSLGVRSRYKAAHDSDALQCDSEPLEVFAKVQHNKQLLKATWQRRQGVRVFFNRAF
jgi:hypothetical protein